MEWMIAHTLGGKSKKFYWRYSDINGLFIKRLLSGRFDETNYSINDLAQIIKFILVNGEVDLANNVQKLYAGDEKHGLGKFIYDNIHPKISDAQTASHLVAVLCNTGVLSDNNKKRGMKFSVKNKDFGPVLRTYFHKIINNERVKD